MDATEQISIFKDFIEKFYLPQLLEAVRKDDLFLEIDFRKLSKYNPVLAEMLLEQPEEVLKAFSIAAEQFDFDKEIDTIQILLDNLPDSTKVNLSEISDQLNKFLTFEGYVMKPTDIFLKCKRAKFECVDCGNIISVLMLGREYRVPTKCGCGRKKGFREISKELKKFQRLDILEAMEEVPDKVRRPVKKNVLIEEHLTRKELNQKIQPGQRVKIHGYLEIEEIKSRYSKRSNEYRTNIVANNIIPIEISWKSIKLTNHMKTKIKGMTVNKDLLDEFAQSLAPSFEGYELVRKSLILQHIGGKRIFDENDNLEEREIIHVLMSGSPGTGKSYLLKRSLKLSPLWIWTQGAGLSLHKDEFIVIKRKGEIIHEKISEYELMWGDECLSLDNELKMIWSKVKDKIEHYTNKKMLRIKAEGGREITVTNDHSIFIIKNKIIKCIKANKLTNKDCILGIGKLPYISEINQFSLEDAKILGIFMGDGNINIRTKPPKQSYKVCFTLNKGKSELINCIVKYAKNKGWGIGIYDTKGSKKIKRLEIHRKEATLYFKKLLQNSYLKTAPFKRIPRWIFNANRDIKLTFLEYYKKTDGFCTSSRGLINDIMLLYSSLGLTASCTYNFPKSSIIDNREIIPKHNSYVIKSQRTKIDSSCKRYNSVPLENVGIPITHHRTRLSHLKQDEKKDKELVKIFNSKLNFYRIKSIEEVQTGDLVYDISCEHERFFGGLGQILCHNTKAGLVAAVVKDEYGSYTLEVGPLVMAHKGIMGLDEMEKMNKGDYGMLNNGMNDEQTKITKATIDQWLKTETPIIATSNPLHKKFIDSEPILEQLKPIPKDIIDRFDTIWAMREEIDSDKVGDKYMARHLDSEAIKQMWSNDEMQKYIAYARRLDPILSPEMSKYFSEKFKKLTGKTTERNEQSQRLRGNILRWTYAHTKFHGIGTENNKEEIQVMKESIDFAFQLMRGSFDLLNLIDEEGFAKYEDIEEIPNKKEVNKYYLMRGVFKKLKETYTNLIPHEILIEEAKKELNLDEEGIEKEIDRLKKVGDIFEPRRGYWGLI